DDEVELLVAVQVAGRDRRGLAPGRRLLAEREPAFAVAVEHEERAALGLEDDDVEVAVAVDVGEDSAVGALADRPALLLLEEARAVVEPDRDPALVDGDEVELLVAVQVAERAPVRAVARDHGLALGLEAALAVAPVVLATVARVAGDDEVEL